MTADVFGQEERPPVETVGRYGQLIYTSFDDGSGTGGGWQVKDQVGDMTVSDVDAMTARIVTKFDVDPPLPQYPTPADIDDRPVRLAYDVIGTGAGVYWHTVAAGTDGSGRPGNVFAHVVFDDAYRAQPALRPIELWGSPDWLRPYGAQEVRAITLHGDHLLRTGGVITVRSVLGFLLNPKIYRLGVFQVLLDAVYDAMAGGRPVVLLTAPGFAVWWIGAVSFFMSPGTSRRFAWTTHDKPDLALADARRGMHLICVPRDYADLPASDWIVIDAEEDPQLGALGGAGHSPARSAFPVQVSPWSLLAQAALENEHTATRVIQLQDDIAREVGDRDLSPVWPLAMASRALRLGDIEQESAQAATDDHPAHLGSSERLRDDIEELYVAGAPQTPEEALLRLTRIRYPGGSQSRAAGRLVVLALRDSEWLGEPGIRLDLVPDCRNVDFEQLHDAVESWLDDSRRVASQITPAESERLVLTVLRVGELLVRVARPGPALDAAVSALSDVIELSGIDFLRDRSRASSFIDSARNISAATFAAVLLPVLASVLREPDAVDLDVWRWMFGNERDLDTREANGPTVFGQTNDSLLSLYITALLEDPDVVDLSERLRSDLAHLGVTSIFAVEASPDEHSAVPVERLLRHYVMTDGQLDRLIARFGGQVTPAMAFQHVFYWPPSEQLDRVLKHVCHYPLRESGPLDDASTLVVAAARVRDAATWTTFEKHWAVNLMDSEVKRLVRELPPEVYEHTDEDLCVPLGALFIAAQSRSRPWAVGDSVLKDRLATRLRSLQPQLIHWIDRLSKQQVIDIGWIAGESMRSRMGPDLAPTALCGQAENESGTSWMDSVIDGQLASGTYRGPSTVDALRDALWDSVKDLSAPTAERFFLEYRSVGKEWLRDRRLLTREPPRSRFSLTHREDNI
ncbi:UNVERIFIED_CONTAM: hypothetical protein DES50_10564 [Williamsia faeni]